MTTTNTTSASTAATAAPVESVYETLDEEVVNNEKQKQLSDWYYIKTSPKPRQWNDWRNKNGKVDYLERYPLKSSSTSHFPPPEELPPPTVTGGGRDPRRLPHPPEIDMQSSLMYQNLVLNRAANSNSAAPSPSIKHSFDDGMFDSPPPSSSSAFIQSESNLKDFHFYENLIEQKMNRLPPPAFAPQSPVSINIVEQTESSKVRNKNNQTFVFLQWMNASFLPLCLSRSINWYD